MGLLVRERYGEAGDLTGYAVAVPGDTTAEGLPVWYGGGRLAPDLTLPRLQRRWTGEPVASGRSRQALIGDLRTAVEQVLADAQEGRPSEGAFEELGDALLAAGSLLGNQRGEGLRRAAVHYDRAARSPGSQRRRATSLRTAARSLARSGRAIGARETITALDLVASLVALTAAVATWHEQQQRSHQATAARTAQAHVAALLAQPPSGGLGEGRSLTQRALGEVVPTLPVRQPPTGVRRTQT